MCDFTKFYENFRESRPSSEDIKAFWDEILHEISELEKEIAMDSE